MGWSDEDSQMLWKDEPFDQLLESIRFIDGHVRKGHNVVIHCAQGKSRSGSVLIAYLMAKRRMTYDEALAFGKARRNILEPNEGFTKQLRTFEKSQQLQEIRNTLN
uniref:Protein-tyrosine-phosphatase n=1 Tax=Arcella intermedia TaxID=1963864 RepID=A0A6B2LTR9_9EUKA